ARGVLLVAEREPGAGVGGDHEAVPARDDLLVARRRRSAAPGGEEEAPRLLDGPLRVSGRQVYLLRRLRQRLRRREDAAPVEIAVRRDAKVCDDERRALGADGRLDLGGRPGEEPAFLGTAVGTRTVGVGGGVEG